MTSAKKLSKKTLCAWDSKDFTKHFDLLTELVASPTHVCKKCGRASSRKSNLCKPVKIEPTGSPEC